MCLEIISPDILATITISAASPFHFGHPVAQLHNLFLTYRFAITFLYKSFALLWVEAVVGVIVCQATAVETFQAGHF